MGNGSKVLPGMDIQPELDPVNQQPDHGIVDGFQLREAQGLTRQAFDPSAPIEVFALNLLCIVFANSVFFDFEMMGSPIKARIVKY